jgi:uncharacterized protein YkwD
MRGSSGGVAPQPRSSPLPAAPATADPACPDSSLQPTSANLARVEATTLCLINEQRAQNGLPALTANSVLQGAALQHSRDMVANNFFSHDSSSGEDFEDRILLFNYAPPNVEWVAGENIAWGTLSLSTPDAIVVSWMNSPEHRANVLSGDYKELGVGMEKHRSKHRKHRRAKQHGGCSGTSSSAITLC